MKKFLLLFTIAIFVCSCGVTKYSQTTYFADFRDYTKDGFTITPSSSGFTYKSIGDISIDFKIGKKMDITIQMQSLEWSIFLSQHMII